MLPNWSNLQFSGGQKHCSTWRRDGYRGTYWKKQSKLSTMVHFQQKNWDCICKFKVVCSEWAQKQIGHIFLRLDWFFLELLENAALKTFYVPLFSLLFRAAPVWFYLPAPWTSLRLFPWCLRSGICCFISSLPLGSSYQFFMLTMAKAAVDCCILTVSLFNF